MNRQEIYAMLCCYQAIRILISRAADDAGTDPRRVSFSRARDGIRSRLSDPGSFPPSGTRRSLRRPGLRDHLPAQPRPRGPAAATPARRAGGRYKTRKPGQSAKLTPLTVIKFWLMPLPP